MQDIIQLTMSLFRSKPLIWRRVQVNKKTTFFGLHQIIQLIMGWENCHLFEFNLQGYRIGEIDEEDKSTGYGNDQVTESKDVRLEDMITSTDDNFIYLYDFGDGWKHEIKVEMFLAADPTTKYPVCIDGAMNCPPEDCGGIHAFYHSMKVLNDKKNTEHKDTARWFKKNYNMESFDKEKVNRKLKKAGKILVATMPTNESPEKNYK